MGLGNEWGNLLHCRPKMDRAIAASTQNQRQRRRWLLVAGAVALLLGSVLAFRSVLKPSLRRSDMLTATVETGDVEASLTAAGTIIPGYEAVIISPIQSTIRQAAGGGGRTGEVRRNDSGVG